MHYRPTASALFLAAVSLMSVPTVALAAGGASTGALAVGGQLSGADLAGAWLGVLLLVGLLISLPTPSDRSRRDRPPMRQRLHTRP